VTDCYKNAQKLLSENVETLHHIAGALLEKEVLNTEELDQIIEGDRASKDGLCPAKA